MIVKCGRVEYELNEKDIVMYNGVCYQIRTRTVGYGYYSRCPIIAKSKAAKFIKDGLLKEVTLDNPPLKGDYLTYYSI